LAGVSLAQCLLPEIVFTFGAIPTTAYTTPTTEEVPREITRWLADYDAMILDRHGSLTVGADIYAAYDKLERMEHVAEITFRARQLGPIRPLSMEQVARLQDVGRSLGLPPRKVETSPCEECNACPGMARAASAPAFAAPTTSSLASASNAPSASSADDAMIARVRDQVSRALVRK
jgi:L-fuculose-phosphate aldolase